MTKRVRFEQSEQIPLRGSDHIQTCFWKFG